MLFIMTTSIVHWYFIKIKVKRTQKEYFTRFLLTFDDNWLDKLITCSRASHNSRFNRRTSLAWRSSVEPYNDEPPDINDAALPCTVFFKLRKKCKQFNQIKHKIRSSNIQIEIDILIEKWWMRALCDAYTYRHHSFLDMLIDTHELVIMVHYWIVTVVLVMLVDSTEHGPLCWLHLHELLMDFEMLYQSANNNTVRFQHHRHVITSTDTFFPILLIYIEIRRERKNRKKNSINLY